MHEIHPMSTNQCTCDFTRLTMGRVCETCTSNRVEALLEEIRAEVGNAGFAAQVGMNALAVDALQVATDRIATVLTILNDPAA